MAKGVIRKILGTGVIGAGVNAAQAAISNAAGPEAGIDPGMHFYERAAAIAQWHPQDVGTASLIGAGLGLGVGAVLRHREYKKEQGNQNLGPMFK